LISVVIPTLDSEREIVPTLSALVSGAAAGIIRDVVLADGGSSDETEAVADAAGCIFVKSDVGARLRAGVQAATRGEWFLFLDPGSMLEEGWTREVRKFLDTIGRAGHADRRAATFRLAYEGFGLKPRIAEAAASARLTLTGRPRAEQGLLISKLLYQKLGGHQRGANAHRRLVAKLGRMRIMKLRSRVLLAGYDE
jgi:glycosyltransferase involved in cell wall biosynthesis